MPSISFLEVIWALDSETQSEVCVGLSLPVLKSTGHSFITEIALSISLDIKRNSKNKDAHPRPYELRARIGLIAKHRPYG